MKLLRGLIIAVLVVLVLGGSVAASANTLQNGSQSNNDNVFVSNMIGIQQQMAKAPDD